MRFVLLFSLVAAVVALGGAGGCARVRPYEREALAQPGMSLAPDEPIEAEQHLLQAREASAGGYGTAGGGCGCN